MVGSDVSVRIWTAHARVETARLPHAGPLVAAEWMAGDVGVLTLGVDGVVSKWTRVRPSPSFSSLGHCSCRARVAGEGRLELRADRAGAARDEERRRAACAAGRARDERCTRRGRAAGRRRAALAVLQGCAHSS